MSRFCIPASQVPAFKHDQLDDSWLVQGYKHRTKYPKEYTDQVIQYLHDFNTACKDDPTLAVRSENVQYQRGCQERALRNPKFSHLLYDHPRYAYEGPYSGVGMKSSDSRFHNQELALMPVPDFDFLHNTPCVAIRNKNRVNKRKLPRKPNARAARLSARQADLIEQNADDGDFRLNLDHADIAQDLRDFRAQKKMPQKILASLLNCRLSELRNIERGKLIPSSTFIRNWDNFMSSPENTGDFQAPIDDYAGADDNVSI